MSKFVIECPHCGSYAEAKTGFLCEKENRLFLRLHHRCPHGQTDRRTCPHCGNNVVFDQSASK